MEILQPVEEAARLAREWQRGGLSIGLVPTMGFLHEGHESLIRRAAVENDRTIVSIFVNPAQFAPHEDLDTYPRDLERDMRICRRHGVHMVFAPQPEQMYPPPFHSWVEVSDLSSGLCGRSRPAHFRGVATVVCKLFNITRADRAYFGQKDAQQLAIVRQMAKDLNMPVTVIGCPIVREADGLAKSSRNAYLSSAERAAAPVLRKTLEAAAATVMSGERTRDTLLALMRGMLAAEPLARVDYLDVVDAVTLQPRERLEGRMLIAAAVFFGNTRLIDNLELDIEGK